MALVLDEGRSIASVARLSWIGATNLGNWVRQARVDRGEREGLTSGERAELAQLRSRGSRMGTVSLLETALARCRSLLRRMRLLSRIATAR